MRWKEVYEASKLDNAFTAEQLQLFENPRPWKPNARRPNDPPELDRFRIRQLIEEDNPGAKVDDVELYTHQFLTYLKATENILRNGTIVAHLPTPARRWKIPASKCERQHRDS